MQSTENLWDKAAKHPEQRKNPNCIQNRFYILYDGISRMLFSELNIITYCTTFYSTLYCTQLMKLDQSTWKKCLELICWSLAINY